MWLPYSKRYKVRSRMEVEHAKAILVLWHFLELGIKKMKILILIFLSSFLSVSRIFPYDFYCRTRRNIFMIYCISIIFCSLKVEFVNFLVQQINTHWSYILLKCWLLVQLYSPPEDSESKFSFFPGIADAISQAAHSTGKEAHFNIQREIWRVARAIQRAAAALRGEPI